MAKRKNEDAIYWKTLRKVEKEMIEWYLEQAGSIRRAAALLGVSESLLIERVKRLECAHPKSAHASTKEKGNSKEATKTSSKKTKLKAKRKPKPKPVPNNVVPLKPNGNGAA